jgi:PAS domain S-box-containing protein
VSVDGAAERLGGARRALDLERARYDELFELSTLGQLVTDGDGIILEANNAAGDLLAAGSERLIGKPVVVFVPLELRREFRERLIRAGESEVTRHWTCEFHGRDGARIITDVTVAASLAGSPDRLRWLLHDVSERYVHQDEMRRLASEYEERFLERTADLEEQQSLLRAVMENMPDGLLVIDVHGAPVHMNEEGMRLLGSAEGDQAKAFEAWKTLGLYRLDGGRLEPEERPIARTLNDGEVVTGEIYEVVVDNRHALFELSTAPVVAVSGRVLGALAVIRDVTTRERAEQAERDFVTNAAHELQSPLAAIVSAVEVLQAGAKDGPQRDVFLDHIERESDRLTRLVRALLILARSQVGVEAPRGELVAVCALLEDVARDLSVAPGVEVEVDCAGDLAMLANRELVEQAVANLAENAAKHTRKGKLVLSAHARPDRVVEIAVTDTGPGIPAAERSKVFDRFYRSRDGANGAGGFGLGLAIVRAVSDAVDGEVELDSTVGVGTSVRLRIPGAARLVEQ